MHLLALLTFLAATAAPPPGASLEAVPEAAGVHVHVAKRGLFSAFAHDHDFEVTRWRGTAGIPEGDPARASLELVLEAGSLQDREKGLSAGDRRKVEGQTVGPAVLDAARYPEIVFRSERVELDAGGESGRPRGTLHGLLTLRGRTAPVAARFEAARDADTWHVQGSARFRQTDFGIEPFTGAGGTVGVKDEVEVTFALALRPAQAAPAADPPP
jgi:polyisoprenoid-binding protein YceI